MSNRLRCALRPLLLPALAAVLTSGALHRGVPLRAEPPAETITGYFRKVQFVRGDSNADARVDISDAIFMLRFLFLGDLQPSAPFPDCDYDPGDAPCSKSVCSVSQ